MRVSMLKKKLFIFLSFIFVCSTLIFMCDVSKTAMAESLVETSLGASIRVSDETPGIRFETKISKGNASTFFNIESDKILSIKEDVELGIIVVPAWVLEDLESNDVFTYLNQKFGKQKSDVSAVYSADKFVLEDDYYVAHGAITNILDNNYNWGYKAISYSIVEGVTSYSNSSEERNIATVAKLALEDGSLGDDVKAGIKGMLQKAVNLEHAETSITLNFGETADLKELFSSIPSEELSFVSDNEWCASVDNDGVVKGVIAGGGETSVKMSAYDGDISYTIPVTVVDEDTDLTSLYQCVWSTEDYVPTASIETKTQYVRENYTNNHSIKLTAKNTTNNFSFRICKKVEEEYVAVNGYAADFRFEFEGLTDKTIVTLQKYVPNTDYVSNLGVAGYSKLNEWNRFIIPQTESNNFVSLLVNDITGATGPFTVYIDNIEIIENPSDLNIVQDGVITNVTFMNAYPEANTSASLISYSNSMLVNGLTNGWSHPFGLYIDNSAITDLTDYDGISFSVLAESTQGNQNLQFFTSPFIKTSSDLLTLNGNGGFTDLVCIGEYINKVQINVESGTYGVGTSGYQKIFISNDTLTRAGYDITDFDGFSILFKDAAAGEVADKYYTKYDQMYFKDFSVYSGYVPNGYLVENNDISKVSYCSQYFVNSSLTVNNGAFNMFTNAWGHNQSFVFNFDEVDLMNAQGISFNIKYTYGGGSGNLYDLNLYTYSELNDTNISTCLSSDATKIKTCSERKLNSTDTNDINVFVSKEVLISAGYDIEHFDSFNIIYNDNAETGLVTINNVRVSELKIVD